MYSHERNIYLSNKVSRDECRNRLARIGQQVQQTLAARKSYVDNCFNLENYSKDYSSNEIGKPVGLLKHVSFQPVVHDNPNDSFNFSGFKNLLKTDGNLPYYIVPVLYGPKNIVQSPVPELESLFRNTNIYENNIPSRNIPQYSNSSCYGFNNECLPEPLYCTKSHDCEREARISYLLNTPCSSQKCLLRSNCSCCSYNRDTPSHFSCETSYAGKDLINTQRREYPTEITVKLINNALHDTKKEPVQIHEEIKPQNVSHVESYYPRYYPMYQLPAQQIPEKEKLTNETQTSLTCVPYNKEPVYTDPNSTKVFTAAPHLSYNSQNKVDQQPQKVQQQTTCRGKRRREQR